ncbi:tRNA-binding protein Pbp11 [Thermococcus aciditolerans]|uniref:Translation factor n=1 Tax=Thermococcus aciditolerans TaxID=2598455 RepID=A0A5C0SKL3_9EURY|nr:tRNA-binding protein Pbp11 [Thermococcus aciditolerans]QEK14820.1 translation factor [Thermococcus aciditolerans]
MGILDRLFGRGRNGGDVQIVSRKPAGRFQVVGVTYVLGKQVLGGVVLEGVIYPGYKLKGGGIALVREIHLQNRKVDFVVEHDEAALVLEGTLKVKEGEIIEVYQS